MGNCINCKYSRDLHNKVIKSVKLGWHCDNREAAMYHIERHNGIVGFDHTFIPYDLMEDCKFREDNNIKIKLELVDEEELLLL